jgi:hypothetical protein
MAGIVLDLSGGGLAGALAVAARFLLGWTLISFGAAVLWSLAAGWVRSRRARWA